MSLILRSRIIVAGASVVAVWLAWQLASGDYAWPALATALTVGGCLVMMFRVPIDALVIGTLFFGYLVGNRGFAQLMPWSHLPLLPAEIGLAIAGGWLAIHFAQQRALPFRRNLLNVAVAAWLIAGTVRVFFDVRVHGFTALRDYAMIYYATFFFIAQHVAGGDARKFLLRALLAASLAQPVAVILVEIFPQFFLSQFAVRGVPLIFFKGDLALTFIAVSALLLYFLMPKPHRWWAAGLATAGLLYVIGRDNRASMLGALVAVGWLAFSRARRFAAGQVAALGGAFLLLAAGALLTESTWAQRKFDGVQDRIASIGDILGRGSYVTEERIMKGSNNRFRLVWWRSVIEETWAQNPAFGLGFGHDLARNFIREYNPDITDDFTARSPHSIVVSAIGRMGLVGLALLVTLTSAIATRTWRAMRAPDTEWATLGLWAALWVILVSACLGVVLEGPMGAVVFWILLGTAAGTPNPETTSIHSDALQPQPASALTEASAT